ncbi:hypothetical protein [Pedobacter agri]|uniref:hypothetical protein n=1 Tax=Pedobacter agri TaxID=454586 RepID=UPI002931EA59|nr:hypothetical protein [Pedobacter agri]
MSYKLDGSDFDDFLLYDQKVENEVTKPANGIVEHLKFVTPKGKLLMTSSSCGRIYPFYMAIIFSEITLALTEKGIHLF